MEPGGYEATGLWQDVSEMPDLLQQTTDRREGFDAVAELLSGERVDRIVVTGNGASYYAGHALWLAALETNPSPAEIVAVPAGLLAGSGFHWRQGDALVAISSSGELRDLVELVSADGAPRPLIAITGEPSSTIGQAADACAVVPSHRQRATTHTQAFCGAVAACLDIWGRVAGDESLVRAVAEASAVCASSIEATPEWIQVLDSVGTPTASVAYGTGVAWAAALEAALMLKEVAQIPAEGVETREAATSSMTAAASDHLVVSLPTGRFGDPLVEEAQAIYRSRGTTVVEVETGRGTDRRLSPIATFAPVVALSAELAGRRGLNVDTPDWVDAYYDTARAHG